MKPYSTTKTASVICTATPYTELDESHTALELAYQDLTRLRAQNAELVEVLQEMEIIRCNLCSGSGHERNFGGHSDDACHACGGVGELVRGGHPDAVRAALAKAVQS